MAEFVDLNRYGETVKNCLSKPVRTGKVLLYGSSFFRVWGYERSLEQLLEASGGELETVNHGFGGATVDELLYHYPRLVAPYAPKAMVIIDGTAHRKNSSRIPNRGSCCCFPVVP